MESIFEDVNWYRAATLSERIATLHSLGHPIHLEKTEADVGAQRMLRWRSQPPFTNASVFDKRLAADQFTEHDLLAVLSEPLECLRAYSPEPPAWLIQLEQAFADAASCKVTSFPECTSDPTFGLLNLVAPLVAHGLDRLKQSLDQVFQEQYRSPVAFETGEPIFLASLSRQLLVMLSRTAVLELNVARFEGLLEGESPEDRYKCFLNRLCQPEVALAILREYPVLARQLTIRLNQWLDFTVEFLERLCADWDLICSTFSPDEHPGVLANVNMDAGDRHRNGRCVLLAKFDSGFQLVYKPKSLAVDIHFQELLSWFNLLGSQPAFRTLRMLDRGAYGWSEFVASETCTSLPALRRFYERQGAYLALLYALEATDLHRENLIAAGEHPVLVDLEAIFHPRCRVHKEEELDGTIIAHSVLRVGLLPGFDWSNAEAEAIDLSGLWGAAGQITPFTVQNWEKPGTDEMRLVRKRMPMPGSRNRPSLNGAEVAPVDYMEEIAAGFAGLYRLIMEHRDDLLSPNGPLARFANDDVRAILRSTRTYTVLLDESFHPDVLRDATDRHLLFDRLWVAVESRPYLAKVIFAESEDLEKGDIPLFTTRPHSRDIWTSSDKCVRDFFAESALETVRRRLCQLSSQDLELQLWMIRASLATTVLARPNGEPHAHQNFTTRQEGVSHDQLMIAACAMGDLLESRAIRWNENASWVGLTLANERQWSISTLMLDLYDGLPGVALFLAHLGAITGEQRYTQLAKEACATMLRRLEEYKSFVTSIGGFNGWGGMVYTLANLGVLWHAPELLAQAEDIVDLLPSLIEQDKHFDLIAGAAGCIAGLIALYQQVESPRVLSAAVRCGMQLISHAQKTECGVGWIIPKQHAPLSGFAHGAAGIAWALLKLSALTGNEDFQTTALAAIAHERSLFSPQTGNWRDLRAQAQSTSSANENEECFMTAWCHGAPGIGLARLSTLQQLDDEDIRQEINAALNTTLKCGFGRNHSLCHGDLGNVELLLQADTLLDEPSWRVEAYRIASRVVESVAGQEYLCGTPLSVYSPGLMTGATGIGYGLLRLAEPERVPSVLTLEPARWE
jgi:type 2 lantibiotic biosynthesis protein LanM